MAGRVRYPGLALLAGLTGLLSWPGAVPSQLLYDEGGHYEESYARGGYHAYAVDPWSQRRRPRLRRPGQLHHAGHDDLEQRGDEALHRPGPRQRHRQVEPGFRAAGGRGGAVEADLLGLGQQPGGGPGQLQEPGEPDHRGGPHPHQVHGPHPRPGGPQRRALGHGRGIDAALPGLLAGRLPHLRGQAQRGAGGPGGQRVPRPAAGAGLPPRRPPGTSDRRPERGPELRQPEPHGQLHRLGRPQPERRAALHRHRAPHDDRRPRSETGRRTTAAAPGCWTCTSPGS